VEKSNEKDRKKRKNRKREREREIGGRGVRFSRPSKENNLLLRKMKLEGSSKDARKDSRSASSPKCESISIKSH
jgi:hypothetical protein